MVGRRAGWASISMLHYIHDSFTVLFSLLPLAGYCALPGVRALTNLAYTRASALAAVTPQNITSYLDGYVHLTKTYRINRSQALHLAPPSISLGNILAPLATRLYLPLSLFAGGTRKDGRHLHCDIHNHNS